jgi:hypothetical protein
MVILKNPHDHELVSLAAEKARVSIFSRKYMSSISIGLEWLFEINNTKRPMRYTDEEMTERGSVEANSASSVAGPA